MVDAILGQSVNWAAVIGLVVGLLVALAIQFKLVKDVLEYVSTKDPEGGPNSEVWAKLRDRNGENHGGPVIGRLEVLLFYIALSATPDGAPLAIGAYLAFKVASKWEVWSHVVGVPDKLTEVDDIEYFAFRCRWGKEVFNRFITGTLLNILLAIFGIGVAHLVTQRLLRFIIIGN